MRLEGRPIGEALATHVAGVSECTRVGHHVPFKFLQDLELHVAYLALERDVDAVVSLAFVRSKQVLVLEGLTALVAGVDSGVVK